MGTEKTIDERLAELEARDRAKEQAATQREKLRRLEREDLREKFEQELGGEEGKAFAIVDLSGTFVVVKKLGGIVYKRLQNQIQQAEKAKRSADPHVDEFIQSHVVQPEAEAVIKMIDDTPGVGNDLFAACANLYGAGVEVREKK